MKKIGFIITILLLPLFLFSQESIEGNIVEFSGTAFIRKGEGDFKKVEVATPVNEGDFIRTIKDSKVVVEFNDKSKIVVYSNSTMKIDNNIASDNSKSLTLLSGRVWASVTKKLSKKNFFKINTPTTTCGVRGTEFGVAVSENGSSLVKVNSGSVAFESDIDPKVEQISNTKTKETESADPMDLLMNDGALQFSVSKINREDQSINTDELTGITKNTVLLEKGDGASFRLTKGINKGDDSSDSFMKEEKMPDDPNKRLEIINWHISNLNKRVEKSDQLLFKVTKISGDIDSMMADKKIDTIKISASTQKGKREMEHITTELNNLQNSMDAQLYFLETVGVTDEASKKLMEKTVQNREKTAKMLEVVEKY
ncbi:FecR domain-containing protein [bacterium]|nr:FecR domain-containing protein [bacterium]